MAINLGYGLAGIGFASVTAAVRSSAPGLSENAIFSKALIYLPIGFAAGAALLVLTARFGGKSVRRQS